MTVALPLSAGSIITLESFLSVCKASLSSLVMLLGGSLWRLSMLTHSELRWVPSCVSGPMILQADSMAVLISLTGRAVGETAKFRPLCRIDSSCWFNVRSDLLITQSLRLWVSCLSTSTIGVRVRSVGGLRCRVRHFPHSALCACVIQLVTSVCGSLGNDVNNSSFKSAINPFLFAVRLLMKLAPCRLKKHYYYRAHNKY